MEGGERLLVAGFRAAAWSAISEALAWDSLVPPIQGVGDTDGDAVRPGSCRALTGKECRRGLPGAGDGSADREWLRTVKK